MGEILMKLSPCYEKYHGVQYTPESLEAAVKLAACHLPNHFLPDKAIDLMDEAGVQVHRKSSSSGNGSRNADLRPRVSVNDISEIISAQPCIPVSTLDAVPSRIPSGAEGDTSAIPSPTKRRRHLIDGRHFSHSEQTDSAVALRQSIAALSTDLHASTAATERRLCDIELKLEAQAGKLEQQRLLQHASKAEVDRIEGTIRDKSIELQRVFDQLVGARKAEFVAAMQRLENVGRYTESLAACIEQVEDKLSM